MQTVYKINLFHDDKIICKKFVFHFAFVIAINDCEHYIVRQQSKNWPVLRDKCNFN